MAGHSKWANTKHRKASQDVKKSKIFTKIIRELIIASKSGGKNPETNPNLRTIIEKALYYNMSRYTIQKTIDKSTSINKNSNLKITQYGAFGKKGIAIMLDCLSNNKNRTVSEIRYIFSKFNFNLVSITAVEYMFKKQEIIFYPITDKNITIKNILMKYGAKYIVNNKYKYIEVISDLKSLNTIKSILSAMHIKPSCTKLLINPYIFITLNQEESMIFSKFIKILQDNTDIQNIYHNVQLIGIT